MSRRHGTVLGHTRIVDHGPDFLRFTIALVSEGYTAGEMPQWEADAQAFADHLYTRAPFDDPALACAINVVRVDVVSDESGADDPNCHGAGDGTRVKTYFDASFCADGETHRAMTSDYDTVLDVLLAEGLFVRAAIVVVNTGELGGAAADEGGVFCTISTHDTWLQTAVHELGHAAFGLADEYSYLASCQDDHYVHPGTPQLVPNISLVGVREQLPWRDLVDPATQVPTTVRSPNCAECDDQDDPYGESSGVVGAYEGAAYYRCLAWRPEFDCTMRNSLVTRFCAVCDRAVRETLAPFATPTPTVTLLHPTVAFPDVEEGTTTAASVSFAVTGCADLSFWVSDWPHRTDGGPEDVGLAPVLDLPLGRMAESEGVGLTRTAHVWITYQATSPGDTLTGTVGVVCNETGDEFQLPITANTVERTSVGVVLALDRSASMNEPTAEGSTKGETLQYAADVFVDLVPDDDGVGVSLFASDAEYGTGVEAAGSGFLGAGRSAARDVVRDYEPDPDGLTSIGDALVQSDGMLGTPGVEFDQWAVALFTDGKETEPDWISDVTGRLSDGSRIFAIGFGTPENLDPATLATLCSGSGGALLLTGADEGDTTFLLAKYFLRILAGVTNTEIVLDPEGYLAPGTGTVRIPFTIAETDTSADVVLVTPVPSAVRFAVETPAGDVVTPSSVVAGTAYVEGRSSSYYRVSLPTLVDGEPARAGTWSALLRLDMRQWTAGDDAPLLYDYLHDHPSAQVNGLPYFVHVQARSNLSLSARCWQDSYEPGAELRVRGVLTEYGLPVDGRATVHALLTRPDGTAVDLPMPEVEPGVFEVVEVAHQSGVHPFQVLAEGTTLRGSPFTRDQLVTGFTYHGGDDPPSHPCCDGVTTSPFPGGIDPGTDPGHLDPTGP